MATHDRALEQVRAICLSFPEVSERLRAILVDAYRKVAPKTLVKQLDADR